MATTLTSRFVETIKTTKEREEFRDGKVNGLELRVTKSGTKTWLLRYRRGSDARKRALTLGKFPDFSLAEAREAAEVARRGIARGGDPAGEKQVRREADTFAEMGEQWLTRHVEVNLRPGSIQNGKSILRRHVNPVIGKMKAAEVKRRDVADLLAVCVRARDLRFADKSTRATRPRKLDKSRRTSRHPNHVFAIIRAVYRWGLAQGIIEHDPTHGMRAPLAENPPRDRVLTPEEIRCFWMKLDEAPISNLHKIMLRLALVTGQRMGEVARLMAVHLDLDAAAPVWTIPATHTKNREAHKVWLTPLALALIREARALAPTTECVFPLPTRDLPTRTSNVVDILKVVRPVLGIDDFRLHDLRRTVATYMGEAGVPDRDIEGVLNHISGGRGVTRRHYDKARREHAKRTALLWWSRELSAIISGQPSIVPELTAMDVPAPYSWWSAHHDEERGAAHLLLTSR